MVIVRIWDQEILDKFVFKKLKPLEVPLTLERAIQLAHQREQVKQQSTERVETGVNDVRAMMRHDSHSDKNSDAKRNCH